MKKLHIGLTLLLLFIVAIVLWNIRHSLPFINTQPSNSDATTERVSPAVKVITKPINFTANDRIFEAVGTARARLSADIYPAVADEVLEVKFEAQQNVKKGDILVQLDDRQEKLAVELAEVELKDAKSLLTRYEQAVKQGAVPQSEVDSARATYEGAEVTLNQAKLDLEERQIIAPFDGYVGIPNIDPGDRVDTDTLITGLDARDILYLDFEVPEALAGALKNAQSEQQQITATTPSYPGTTFKGRITAQESRIDPGRRTLMARASIENTDDLLRPGMSFTVRWDIPGKDYATVPEISLQWGREGSFIWIIRDGQAKKVMTRVIARKAGQVLLEGELKENEEVVIEGLQRLRPDVNVDILNKEQS